MTRRLFLTNQAYFRGGEMLKGDMWDIQRAGLQDKRFWRIQRQGQNKCFVLYGCIELVLTSLQIRGGKMTPTRMIFISCWI